MYCKVTVICLILCKTRYLPHNWTENSHHFVVDISLFWQRSHVIFIALDGVSRFLSLLRRESLGKEGEGCIQNCVLFRRQTVDGAVEMRPLSF